jgi:hypothetical protein
MKILHISPGDSAGGSIAQALRDGGRDDEVLRFLDDLSCGPIDSDEASARAAWWGRFYEPSEVEATLSAFWERVASTDDQLVVWFGRHSARELAFFLAWADRVGDRPYQIIDVTGRQLPTRRRDGSPALSRPAGCVSILQPESLRSLLGQERLITARERDESRLCWERLRGENAPFRVITETGLVSAPVDYFDWQLLEQASSELQPAVRVVMRAIGYNSEPFTQVGDVMLRTRIAALVADGRLLAEGDPTTWSCRVRLPD